MGEACGVSPTHRQPWDLGNEHELTPKGKQVRRQHTVGGTFCIAAPAAARLRNLKLPDTPRTLLAGAWRESCYWKTAGSPACLSPRRAGFAEAQAEGQTRVVFIPAEAPCVVGAQ